MENFAPTQYSYRQIVEEGKKMPTILVEKAEQEQIVRIDTTNGNAIITVLAEDTTYQSTYSIYFDYQKSSYSYLEGIYQDGILIDGFRVDSFDYHILLPYGTTALPEFTYQLGKDGQIVTIDTIASNNKTTFVFTVIAPDEESASTYNLQVEISLNNNSLLKTLHIKGVELANFDADSTYYTLSYPIGTDSTELVNKEDILATPEDSNAIVTISQTGYDITILVTAEDAITTTIYTIKQVIQQSSNTRLSALYIDSVLIRGFDPNVYEYSYYVTDVQPTIMAIAEDSVATIEYSFYTANTPYYIYVTAQDGSEQVYTIYFMQSTIQTAATPNPLDVMMKHIKGTQDIAFATIRKNVSVAVYAANGQILFHATVPESSQNDVIIITNAEGQEELIDVHTPLTTFTMPEANQTYFYVFFENEKNRIASGKIFFAK
jgi:hypothetical protein